MIRKEKEGVPELLGLLVDEGLDRGELDRRVRYVTTRMNCILALASES